MTIAHAEVFTLTEGNIGVVTIGYGGPGRARSWKQRIRSGVCLRIDNGFLYSDEVTAQISMCAAMKKRPSSDPKVYKHLTLESSVPMPDKYPLNGKPNVR